jgi:hypothetical protein
MRPEPTNGELIKMVAGHEAILSRQVEITGVLQEVVSQLTTTVAVMVSQQSTAHTPSTCQHRTLIEQHDRDLRQLREDSAAAKAAGRALYWVAGLVATAVSLLITAAPKIAPLLVGR